MSVNDKWHYCHNSEVLVGSRAMRDRHLRLLGYIILQVNYPQCTAHDALLVEVLTSPSVAQWVQVLLELRVPLLLNTTELRYPT